VRLEPADAAGLVEEVRRRVDAGAEELKASRLNRPWGRPVAAWLCAPDGPLTDRAAVHLTDSRLFGLARLAQVLRTDTEPEGWWNADEQPAAWEHALRLDAVLAGLPRPREREVLTHGRDLLWLTRSRRPRDPVEGWVRVVTAAAGRAPDAATRAYLAAWTSPEAVRRGRRYLERPPASPLTEPLLPALRWALHHWSERGDVEVVHDEQSALTPARVAALGDELAAAHPGRRLLGLRRVDSREDPRVQVADLVAGVVRRTVADQLSGVAASAVPVSHLVATASPLRERASGVAAAADQVR
jgi:hypothetical protein